MHEAADGGLARVRVPGGVLTPHRFRTLAIAAAELGDGGLELTSRANVQVRGLQAGQEQDLAERLGSAGLLPSETHERVRNIIGSPYQDGRELLDVPAVASELDVLLCRTPRLAELPGRFLFAVDDGRADVASLGADVGLLALSTGAVMLILAGADSGVRLAPRDGSRAAVLAAEAFLDAKADRDSPVWRITELDGGVRRIAERVSAELDVARVDPVPVLPAPPATHAQVGEVFRRNGRVALAAGAPLGRLSADQVDIIIAASDAAGELRLTPWRTVVVPGLPEDEAARWLSDLDARGLLVDPLSEQVGVTSCTGHPGCAKAIADVRKDAKRALRRPAADAGPAGALPVHWAGCERRCGRPQGRVVEVLATEAGYEISLDGEVWTSAADADRIPAALDAARRAVE